ncbi:MAG: hypothetical protein K6E50_01320 [Lachnospiraceae bacterium]|nr:hypothetical protein [Lachnospiraceae bacterium]
MLLCYLNEKAKEEFLMLAVKAAAVNGVIEKAEKDLIDEYCYEVKLPIKYDDIDLGTSLEELFDRMRNYELRSKKIIVFEIICLLHIDGVFDEDEKNFAYDLIHHLDLSEEVAQDIFNVAENYIDVVTRVNESILV